MSKPMNCLECGGDYVCGSALFDYYSCGHAFEKPLNHLEAGRWIKLQNPHVPQAEGK